MIDVVNACRNNRFDETKDTESSEGELCSDIVNFNLVKIVNDILEWYAVDKLIKYQLDEKIHECEQIL